jgi:stage II sporulation protein M
MKKRKSELGELYKSLWGYIKESREFIFIVVGVFAFFCLVGFFVAPPDSVNDMIREILQDILKQTEGLSNFQLITFIFFNNLKSSFFGLILGLGAGIFPVISTISNGYILGFVGNLSVGSSGIWSLWRILPHGIFELPAVFISLGLGLKLGVLVVSKKKKGELKKNFINSLRVFLFVVVPLLIIAAIIEGTLISLTG